MKENRFGDADTHIHGDDAYNGTRIVRVMLAESNSRCFDSVWGTPPYGAMGAAY